MSSLIAAVPAGQTIPDPPSGEAAASDTSHGPTAASPTAASPTAASPTTASPAAGAAAKPRREPLPDNAPHILLVDDDQRIRELLSRVLYDHGFRCTPACDTAAARAAMRSLAFDLVLLDVMMPGQNGLDFARELKAMSPIPICMLTARSETEERIEGLEAGVDDYVSKPFETRELVLRIKNILRRGRPSSGPADEVRMGEYTFHVGRGELKKGDEVIRITERERDLLRLFASRPGIPIARHELIDPSSPTTGNERAIDVQINRLRRKIESNSSAPVYLQTARGKGYVLFTD